MLATIMSSPTLLLHHRVPPSWSSTMLLLPQPVSLRRLRLPTHFRCTSSNDGRDESGALPEMVDKLLRREENSALLQRLQDAELRVDRAREALRDIERDQAQVQREKEYVMQLQKREAQIAESQRELLQAREMVESAQHSLSSNISNNSGVDNRELERFESVKAAFISSIIGTLAALPLSIYQTTSFTQLIVHLVVISISCALFGVTFRYTVRRDLDNLQLKTGTVGAFVFVKGFAALEADKLMLSNLNNLIPQLIDGGVLVSENILVFLFSAVALDFCFKMRFLSPFPMEK